MIKISSILFVSFVVLMFLFGIIISFIPALGFLNIIIYICSICLLVTGIILIIALIFDRFKDSKSEGDDYKKY